MNATPLGLIWARRLRDGRASLEEIASAWPEMSVGEILRILAVVHRRYPQLANHCT